MDVSFLEGKLEFLSEEAHKAWMTEQLSQGFHSPAQCTNHDPSDDKRQSSSKFTKQCGKCHADLYDYGELPENVKEHDRVTVRAVIRALEKL